MAQQPQTPEQALAWEAERRPRAVFAAATGALLVLGGGIFSAVESSRRPTVGVVQAISPALHGQVAARVDPHLAAAHFYDEHAAKLATAAGVAAVGSLLTAYLLVYLAHAVRSRRPDLPPAFSWLPPIGAVAATIGSIGLPLVIGSNARDYLAGPHTADALDKIRGGGGAVAVLTGFAFVGQLALAFGIVVISLNAMRVGLLTRFMGVLGIIVGVLFIIPLGTLPVVQAFWLGAVGLLVAQRWPSGQPPAWITGASQPWPSGQDVRRQQEAERNRAEAQAIKAAPADSEVAEPVRPAHPSSKKRRKKRRQ